MVERFWLVEGFVSDFGNWFVSAGRKFGKSLFAVAESFACVPPSQVEKASV